MRRITKSPSQKYIAAHGERESLANNEEEPSKTKQNRPPRSALFEPAEKKVSRFHASINRNRLLNEQIKAKGRARELGVDLGLFNPDDLDLMLLECMAEVDAERSSSYPMPQSIEKLDISLTAERAKALAAQLNISNPSKLDLLALECVDELNVKLSSSFPMRRLNAPRIPLGSSPLSVDYKNNRSNEAINQSKIRKNKEKKSKPADEISSRAKKVPFGRDHWKVDKVKLSEAEKFKIKKNFLLENFEREREDCLREENSSIDQSHAETFSECAGLVEELAALMRGDLVGAINSVSCNDSDIEHVKSPSLPKTIAQKFDHLNSAGETKLHSKLRSSSIDRIKSELSRWPKNSLFEAPGPSLLVAVAQRSKPDFVVKILDLLDVHTSGFTQDLSGHSCANIKSIFELDCDTKNKQGNAPSLVRGRMLGPEGRNWLHHLAEIGDWDSFENISEMVRAVDCVEVWVEDLKTARDADGLTPIELFQAYQTANKQKPNNSLLLISCEPAEQDLRLLKRGRPRNDAAKEIAPQWTDVENADEQTRLHSCLKLSSIDEIESELSNLPKNSLFDGPGPSLLTTLCERPSPDGMNEILDLLDAHTHGFTRDLSSHSVRNILKIYRADSGESENRAIVINRMLRPEGRNWLHHLASEGKLQSFLDSLDFVYSAADCLESWAARLHQGADENGYTPNELKQQRKPYVF